MRTASTEATGGTIHPQAPFVLRLLLKWGHANRRSFPWRDETDPFRILVAEVLLQRSRSRTVAKVYEDLFQRWPDAESLAAADEAEIRAVIQPLGLTNRARYLKGAAADVVARGGVPRSVQEMVRLAGVGRYAASATAVTAFGERAATVDGTSARVYRRVFGLKGERDSAVDEKLWGLVEEVTPRRGAREWNWAVLDLAAAICLPKVPRCPECPLKEVCVTGRERISSQPLPKITNM